MDFIGLLKAFGIFVLILVPLSLAVATIEAELEERKHRKEYEEARRLQMKGGK
jgi:hypothetical protein